MENRDAPKRTAGTAAAKLVERDMLVGLGTGSTVEFLLDALASRIREENLTFTAVATSQATETLARARGMPVISELRRVDLAIDGADEVEIGTLRLIKGLGGALLREKIVAQSAHRFVVIADEGKLVTHLGAKSPVPVEVIRFGHEHIGARLESFGFEPALRHKKDGEVFVTDNGNVVFDCRHLPQQAPENIESALKSIAGVVETGLFTFGVEQAIIAADNGQVMTFPGDFSAKAGVAADAAVLRRLLSSAPSVVPPIIIMMGVSGAGKTTIGACLAAVLGIAFQDADDLHPAENVEKMHRGEPLNDRDRLPWLHRIAAEARAWRQMGQGGIIACSALNRRYRDIIVGNCAGIVLVHLEGSKEVIETRMNARHGHFMPSTLLDSQFAALEPPEPGEGAIAVSIVPSPARIVIGILEMLAARERGNPPYRNPG